MTNAEKYKDQIYDIFTTALCHPGLQDGKPVPCEDCFKCDFFKSNTRCADSFQKWLNEEYKSTDWTKVPIDTRILVREYDNTPWKRYHFAMYENGNVYAFTDGQTSWSSFSGNMSSWRYAKLAKEEKT